GAAMVAALLCRRSSKNRQLVSRRLLVQQGHERPLRGISAMCRYTGSRGAIRCREETRIHEMRPKKAPPTVRPVRPEDYDAWKLLWDEYNAFYERTGPTALPDEVTQTTWRRFFDANEPVHCIVAERDGQVLGICHYLFHRSTSRIEP